MRIVAKLPVQDGRHLPLDIEDDFRWLSFSGACARDIILTYEGSGVDIATWIDHSAINGNYKSRVLDLIQRIPKSQFRNQTEVDFSISKEIASEKNVILDLIINKKIQNLLNKRKIPIQFNEYRQNFYDRCFAPLTKTAKMVSILDPFLIMSLRNAQNGAIWLIDQLTKDGIEVFNIYSRIDPLENINEFKSIFTKQYLKSQQNLKLNFYLFTSSRSQDGSVHGRHIRFHYGVQELTPTIELEKGLASFDRQIMNGTELISEGNQEVATRRELRVKNGKSRIAPFALTSQ